MSSPRRLFISHTAADFPYAQALQVALDDLAGKGEIDVKYSTSHQTGISGGEDWRAWVDDQVLNYWTALIVITPNSVSKPWLMWEAGACQAVNLGERTSGEPDGPRKIVALAFGVAQGESPDPLRREQVVNGAHPAEIDKLFSEILEHHDLEVAPAANRKDIVDAYLETVRTTLLKRPSLVNEANVNEWLVRIEDLGTERGSELQPLERWMRLAFGREDATSEVPIDVRLHRRLGDLYKDRREYARAITQFDLARTAAPRDMFVLRPLGEVLIKHYLEIEDGADEARRRELRDSIRQVFAAMEALDPKAFLANPDAAAQLAKYQRRAEGNAEAAIDTLAAALDVNRDSYYLADVLGQAQVAAGLLDAAAVTYQEALNILDRLHASGESGVWPLATRATANLVLGATDRMKESLRAIAAERPERSDADSIAGGLREVNAGLGKRGMKPKELDGLLARLRPGPPVGGR